MLRRRYFPPRKGKKCPDRPPNNRGTAGPAISADKKGENGKRISAVSGTRMEDVPRAYRGEKYRF